MASSACRARREYTPERVAAWTGMTPPEIEQLAREYATTRPAALRLNYGVQRTENGGTAVRAIAMLPALTGAWKHRGGGAQLSTSGALQWNKKRSSGPISRWPRRLEGWRAWSTCRAGRSADELGRDRKDQGTRPQPKTKPRSGGACALCLQLESRQRLRPITMPCAAASRATDLFTVVHELFFTDTTDYADYILPATTFLEHTDIQGAYGHYFVQLSQQAIEPPGEARSNVWLFSQLAQRMGFPEDLLPRYAGRDHPSGARHRRRRPLDQPRHGAHHASRT
jgi:anaerobic selenocysteine-containing dehydrogenase